MRRSACTFFIVVILVSNGHAYAADYSVLTVGLVSTSWNTGLPTAVARGMGYFAEEGLEVRLVTLATSGPIMTVFGKEYSLIIDTPAVEFVDELVPLSGEVVVQKCSHDCFYKTTMEEQLRKLDLQPCRDHIFVTGIGSNNCVYHAVIGFHIRNDFVTVPEDCIHASRAEGQAFALSQFRSSAYNFNVDVLQSEELVFSGSKRAAVA
jgi:nicotinamidase-related amidase